MKLRFPLLEKKIKGRIKAEIRTSKSLMAEEKRLKPSFWTSHLPSGSGAYILMISFPCIFLLNSGIGVRLFVFSLFMASTISFICASFLTNLRRSNDLFILSHYPLRDDSYFSLQWRKCLRSSLFIPLISLIYFSGFELLYKGDLARGWSWIAVFSLLNWLEALLLVMVLTYFFRRIHYGKIGIIGILSAIACIIASRYMPADFSLDSPWILWMIPSGINNMLFLYGVHNGVLSLKLLSLLGLLSIPAIFVIHSKYRSSYRSEVIYESYLLYGEDGDAPGQVDEIGSDTGNPEILDFKGASEISKRPVGWVERTVLRFLSDKELGKARYLYSDFGSNWSSCWKYGLIFMMLCFASMIIYPKSENIASVAALLAFAVGIPILGGSWRCFTSFYWHPGFYQFNLSFPISYWETSKFMLKVNLIRIILWIPVTVAAGAFIDWRLNGTGIRGLILSSELILMMIALQPLLVSLKFGLLNSDTEITFSAIRKAFVSTLVLLAEALFVIGAVIMAVFGVSVEKYWLTLIAVLFASIISLMSWLINGILFDRSRVDFGVRRTNPVE